MPKSQTKGLGRIPLPIPCRRLGTRAEFRCRRFCQIISKAMIEMGFSSLRGGLWAAKNTLVPALRDKGPNARIAGRAGPRRGSAAIDAHPPAADKAKPPASASRLHPGAAEPPG